MFPFILPNIFLNSIVYDIHVSVSVSYTWVLVFMMVVASNLEGFYVLFYLGLSKENYLFLLLHKSYILPTNKVVAFRQNTLIRGGRNDDEKNSLLNDKLSNYLNRNFINFKIAEDCSGML